MSMNYDGEPRQYTYSQGPYGKSAFGIVANGAQSSRDPGTQREAGGADRQPGDHGGHLIAHSLGGRNDATNIDAQAAEVNQKDQRSIERNIASLAANPNNTVALSVTNYNSVGQRPDATMINVGVRNNTTGEVEEQHISFQNASHYLQESWNNSVEQKANEIEPSQEAGLTPEQREAANELCGAENFVDMSIGKGGTYMEFDMSPSLDTGVEGGIDAGVEEGIEGGIDAGVEGGIEGGIDAGTEGGMESTEE